MTYPPQNETENTVQGCIGLIIWITIIGVGVAACIIFPPLIIIAIIGYFLLQED